MGLVYSGISEETGEEVVVKLLLDEHQRQPSMVRLFEESARLQQSLQHPNIAPVISVGQHEGLSFIVQPYYRNGSLDQWFRQIDLQLVTRVFHDVCTAVQFAHAHGAIHGDIKPPNVLIGTKGQILLTDFMALSGLSQVMASSGIRWATPMYMAPEMLAWNKLPDVKTDIYALGLLLFEIVRGYLPKQSDTRMALASAVIGELPLSLDPNYHWVNDIIGRSVNPDPSKRFASVAEVIEAISELPTRPEWPQYQPSYAKAWLQEDNGHSILEITESTYAIGSDKRCQVVVDDKNVASLHAEIEFRDDSFVLRRVLNSEPLAVNNEPVRVARVLHRGDQITVGKTQLRFVLPEREITVALAAIRHLPIAWFGVSKEGKSEDPLAISEGTTCLVDIGPARIELQSVAEKLFLSAKGPIEPVLVNQVPVSKVELSERDVIRWMDTEWTVHFPVEEWMELIDDTLLRHGDVIENLLQEIPRSCRAVAMRKYADQRTYLDISFSEARSSLRCNDIQRLRLFRLLWSDCKDTFARRIGVEVTAELVSLMREKLLVAQENTVGGLGSRHGPFIAFDLDISSVVHGLNLPNRIPLVLAQCAQFSPDDFPSLLRAVQFHVHSPHLAIIVFMDETTRVLLLNVVEQLGQHGINALALGREDMQRVLFSRDPRGSLRRMLLSKTDLSVISPFVVVGPVRRQLFFGREAEMGRIAANVSNASFALVAGRRYGKTSTLQRLHSERLSTKGYHALLYDCSRIDPSQPLSACVVDDDDWKPGTPPNAPANLDDLLQWTPSVPMVLLLDEADRLVMIDRRSGWRTFSILRVLANAGRCQVVLGGERAVHEAILDPSTPLFNFVTRIPLGPLDFNAVEELITRPFRQMEIGFSDEKEVVRRCFEFTSGHPNIVQRLCARLVTTLNLHNTRQITLDDVDEVIADPKFQEEDFLQTYWSQASDLEQIITLLMAGDDKPVRFGTILDLLASEGLQPEPVVVKKALDRLVDLRAILRRLPSGYEFAIAAFPQVLANTATAEDLLPVLKSQYRQNPHETMESAKSYD